MDDIGKRGPGRPRKITVEVEAEEPVAKKGRKSWRPAQAFHLDFKKPGYRYRFCSDDPDNLRKKLDEGWEFVNPVTHGANAAEMKNKSAALTSERRYRSLVLMALPEETAAERDAYFQDLTTRQDLRPAQRARQMHQDEHPGKNPNIIYAVDK